MTEREARERVVAQTHAWLGLRESDGSHREILAVYNAIRPLPRGYAMRDSDPWCAAFVSAVGAACGLTAILYPECACGEMLRLYEKAGRFEENDDAVPAPGDVIFYDWQDTGRGDCRGEPDHVGLVTEVLCGVVTVIEGNRSDRVAIREIETGAPCIRGYGKPDYAAGTESVGNGLPGVPQKPEDGASEKPSSAAEQADACAALSLPVLRRGSRGESVRAAQLLLIGRGYRCGPWGADGDFGPATQGGLVSFQRGRHLKTDGVLGAETWAALLGVSA